MVLASAGFAAWRHGVRTERAAMKEAENALRSFMLAVRKYLVELRLLETRTSSGGSPRSQRKEDELVRGRENVVKGSSHDPGL
tara:strand:+ start:326 stop:574 length:249 start_codon:yes stop_codon:yes gene_type:complete